MGYAGRARRRPCGARGRLPADFILRAGRETRESGVAELIAAIDQGTTSTRCLLFDAELAVRGAAQKEHRQIFPGPGLVEHDAEEIWRAVEEVVVRALAAAGADGVDVAAVGITNQRETVVCFDPETGRPHHNAIVWQDTRSRPLVERLAGQPGGEFFRRRSGLPLATYFSAPKIRWLLDHAPGLAQRARAGRVRFATMDAWLVYRLTGGADGGVLASDVTNASRTQLMSLAALDWDPELLDVFGVDPAWLPRIAPSADAAAYGVTRKDGPFGAERPILGVLGDQQAALVGQRCFRAGDRKNTYGTGCFLLENTGGAPVFSSRGLITTVAYRCGAAPAAYALEGAVAVAGALIQWLRDGLGLIAGAAEVEALARSVPDSGGVYIVPAFSGLFAPYWRSDARGVITGLTQKAGRGELARAALEATAYQTHDLVEAMAEDRGAASGAALRVDGGMAANDLLLQFQADILGVPVARGDQLETTALGAAYAAGRQAGVLPDPADFRAAPRGERLFEPQMGEEERRERLAGWKKALQRSLDWV